MTVNTHSQDGELWIGTAKSDVTGPVAGYTFMGYARAEQLGIGLFNRLYARTFAISDKSKSNHVLLVHCDLHSISTYMRQRVLDALREEYGGVYNEDNVLLHAQHTHSGPGGYFTYYMYYLTTWGYHDANFNTILNGILASVREARSRMELGFVELSVGDLGDTGRQRSMEAYMMNSEAERSKYKHDHDTLMTNLAFRRHDNSLIGVFNVFAVHPTNFVGDNGMVSSDNKGYAEWYLEKKYPGSIIAFAQGTSGDISPNHIDNLDGTYSGEEATYVASAEKVGRRQADEAERLTFSATAGRDRLGTGLSSKTRYVDFSNIELDDGSGRITCPAVIGQTFLAGTEDGRGVPMLREDMKYHNPLASTIGHVFFASIPHDVAKCHSPKLPGLGPGVMDPLGSPKVLPIQVVRIGELVIVAVPFEMTSMAGRRLRESVLEEMAHQGVKHVAITANSNGYAGYLTTREEYQAQHYEGASTHFGPNQLDALIQETLKASRMLDPDESETIATNLSTEKWSRPGPDRITQQHVVSLPRTHVIAPFDIVPNLAQEFGQPAFGGLITKGNSYAAGKSIVTAAYWGAHPANQFSQVPSFCDVERVNDSGVWEIVLRDDDWTLRYYWRRRFYVLSVSYCEWAIDGSIPAGRYRIAHHGIAKRIGGNFEAFTGYSPEVYVQPETSLSAPSDDDPSFLHYERHTDVGHLQINTLENIIGSVSFLLLIVVVLGVRWCIRMCQSIGSTKSRKKKNVDSQNKAKAN